MSTTNPEASFSPVTRFDVRNLPEQLQAHPHWVNWKAKQNGPRIDKIPICPETQGPASVTDPGTWADFRMAALNGLRWELGIGVVLAKEEGLVGIDIDHCVDPMAGIIDEKALAIVHAMNSYTEISPSGTGLRIFVRGTLPPGRRKRGPLETYSEGRYLTVTGNQVPGTPSIIEERTAELAAFHAEYLADPEPTITPPVSVPTLNHTPPRAVLYDYDILKKCRAAANSAKFERLWSGDHSGHASRSEADLALLGQLKFYTQDPLQLDRLFRQSGLMRPKWDERRGENLYGEKTIEEALKHGGEVYSPSHHTMNESHGGSVWGVSVPSSDVWPEIQPIKTELLPVDPLLLDLIPTPFRDWVDDVSTRMQCPPDYVVAAMLTMTGAIIGAGCGIRPKQHDDWTVVPNVWGGVVGRPSMLKTPAIAEAMRPIDQLERVAKLAYDTARKKHEAEYEVFKARKESLQSNMRKVANGKEKPGQGMDVLKDDFSTLEEPPPPVWQRYRTNDCTIEKIADLLKDNPRGILAFRDELAGQLASWDREGHEPDRAFFLEAWNGSTSHTCDRIGRGTIFIENLCVSLFGGTQPTKLTYYLHQAVRGTNNDGFVQRLQLLVYPDEPKTWRLVDTPVNTEARQRAHRVVERLATMDFRQHGAFGEEGQRPYYRFNEEAQSVFNEWLTEHEARLRRGDDEPVVIEHLAKYRSLMPSLALIFHLLDIADGQPASQVTAESATRAAAFCEYLESHARRVYGLVTNLTNQAASRLAVKIQEKALPDPFSVRNVYMKGWGLLGDKQVAKDACEELVALGWLKERVTPPAQGQRGKIEYVINPKVRDL